MAQLHCTAPGTVWAIDHSEPPQPIDGCYPAVVALRDLASGMQLAWLPVPDATETITAAVLESLFHKHGPPLVLKSDNGSAFLSRDWNGLLDRWRVMPLRSPPATPRYNGSCEAGIGSMKLRTTFLAARAGHPQQWTSDDLEAARRQANELTRSRRAPSTPQERWDLRRRLTTEERDRFTCTVDRLSHTLTLTEDCSVASPSHFYPAIHRRVVRQALRELGFFSVTWRSISLPLSVKKVARIL